MSSSRCKIYFVPTAKKCNCGIDMRKIYNKLYRVKTQRFLSVFIVLFLISQFVIYNKGNSKKVYTNEQIEQIYNYKSDRQAEIKTMSFLGCRVFELICLKMRKWQDLKNMLLAKPYNQDRR